MWKSYGIRYFRKGTVSFVEILKDLGGIPFQKTNTPFGSLGNETENYIHGRTISPINSERSPGGSSGGESVLVKLGCSPLGVALDNAGSVRTPALNCGLNALKFGMKRVPLNPILECYKQKFCHSEYGFITKSTRDMICASKAVFESEKMYQDHTNIEYKPFDDSVFNPSKKLRIASLDKKLNYDISLANKNALENAITALTKKGHVVENINDKVGDLSEEIYDANHVSIKLLRTLGKDFSDEWTSNESFSVYLIPLIPKWVLRILLFVFTIKNWKSTCKTIEQVITELNQTEQENKEEKVGRFRDKIYNIMEENKYDCLLTPSGFTPPLPIGYSKRMGVLQSWIMLPNILLMSSGVVKVKNVEKFEENYEGNMQDQDLITSDIRKSLKNSTGMPVGVQVNGLPFREEYCLRIMDDIYNSFLG